VKYYVDGDGAMKGLPLNVKASKFYPVPNCIYGDALFMHVELEYHEDGPDHVVGDLTFDDLVWIKEVIG